MATTKLTMKKISDELHRIAYEGLDVDDDGNLVIDEDSPLWHLVSQDDIPVLNLHDALDTLNMKLEDKMEQTVHVITDLEIQANGVGEHIKELQAYKNALESRAKGLKDYLKFIAISNGIKSFMGKLVRFTIRKSPIKAIVATDNRGKPDPMQVDPTFTYEVTETKIDTKAAIAYYKQTKRPVKGFVFQEGNHHLVIPKPKKEQ